MAPEQSEGATKGLRVINYVDPWVLKFKFLDYSWVILPLQLLVTTKQGENVVVVSPIKHLLYLTLTGSQCYEHAIIGDQSYR